MQVNPQNIDAVIKGTEKAMSILKEKEEGWQNILNAVTNNQVDVEKFIRSFTKLAQANLSEAIAEVEAVQGQLNQLKFIKDKMDSNIIVPQMGIPQSDNNSGPGPKIIL